MVRLRRVDNSTKPRHVDRVLQIVNQASSDDGIYALIYW